MCRTLTYEFVLCLDPDMLGRVKIVAFSISICVAQQLFYLLRISADCIAGLHVSLELFVVRTCVISVSFPLFYQDFTGTAYYY